MSQGQAGSEQGGEIPTEAPLPEATPPGSPDLAGWFHREMRHGA